MKAIKYDFSKTLKRKVILHVIWHDNLTKTYCIEYRTKTKSSC